MGKTEVGNYQDQTMVHRIDRFVPINGTNVGAQ